MIESIRMFAFKTGQKPPSDQAEYTRSVYLSLALQIRWCIERLERTIQEKITHLHLFGGGAKDNYFCESVADCSGLSLEAGPEEATILGNVMVQLLAAGEVSSLSEIREVVQRSRQTRGYTPKQNVSDEWGTLYEKFLHFKKKNPTCTKI